MDPRDPPSASTGPRGATPTRRELLLRAVSASGETPEVARGIYLLLDPPLDPGSGAEREHIERLFTLGSSRVPGEEALAARGAAHPAAPPGFRLRMRLRLAECAADGGRPAEAERRFLALLKDCRGGDPGMEFDVCNDLCWFFLGRFREIEALAFARRCREVATGEGRRPEEARAWFRTASALLALGDVPRAGEALDRLESLLEDSPPEAWRLRALAAGLRVEAALQAGDAGGARAGLRSFEERTRDAASTDWDVRWDAWLRGSVLLAEGRAREAAAEARSAGPPRGEGTSRQDLRLRFLGLKSGIAAGSSAEAAVEAEALLRILESGTSEAMGAGNRFRSLVDLGHLLEDGLGDTASARKAYDLAATVLLERLTELERAAVLLPEVSDTPVEELRILDDYRARVMGERIAILDRVREILRTELEQGVHHLPTLAGLEGYVTVCAWCRRIRGPEGSWIPLGVLLPGVAGLPVTHGICERCLEGALPRRLREAPPEGGA